MFIKNDMGEKWYRGLGMKNTGGGSQPPSLKERLNYSKGKKNNGTDQKTRISYQEKTSAKPDILSFAHPTDLATVKIEILITFWSSVDPIGFN